MNFKRAPSSNINPQPKSGMVVGYERKGDKEEIYYLEDDIHSLILGATRSGKTRGLILQSICDIALTGESMIISDPKGEIYNYAINYLQRCEYEVIAVDFKSPLLSERYNFLQPVINAVKENDMPKAIDLVWDITSALVPETKGEKIWQNGESSIIAGAIMSVVWDNCNFPEYQNLSTVYSFINTMSQANSKSEMYLTKYVKSISDDHPAKEIFGVALVAPERTRGSFLTSALSTLRLFTNPNIYSLTNKSDFLLDETGSKKRAIFIILPDEKNTFNSLASLFVQQQYAALVEKADERGGRLLNRVNFILDEFGNFTQMPNFLNMLTVGAGRGIRFNIVLQSLSQLDEKYGQKQAEAIKDNCHCFIYLASSNPNTNSEISKRLGKYTTSSYGQSSSTARGGGNSSSSMNLVGRELLTSDELAKLKRPDVLVMLSGRYPAMLQIPDISKWQFDVALGLGDEDFNNKVRLYRQSKRQKRGGEKIARCHTWDKYIGQKIINAPIPYDDFPEDDFVGTFED